MRFRNMYREFTGDQRFKNHLEARDAFLGSSFDDAFKQLDAQRQRDRAVKDELRSAIASVSESSLETTCKTAPATPSSLGDDDFYQREEEERRRRLSQMQSSYYLPRT